MKNIKLICDVAIPKFQTMLGLIDTMEKSAPVIANSVIREKLWKKYFRELGRN